MKNIKIGISKLKNKDNIKYLENKSIIKTNDKNNKTDNLFYNYKSEFDNKNEYFIKKNKLPKTRYHFIIPLIIITVVTIFLVFKFQPKIHNIKNYKTQILSQFEKKEKNLEKEKLQKIKKFLIENRK